MISCLFTDILIVPVQGKPGQEEPGDLLGQALYQVQGGAE